MYYSGWLDGLRQAGVPAATVFDGLAARCREE